MKFRFKSIFLSFLLSTFSITIPLILSSCSKNNVDMVLHINNISSSKINDKCFVYISGNFLSNNINDYEIVDESNKPIVGWEFDEVPSPQSITLVNKIENVKEKQLLLKINKTNISKLIPTFEESIIKSVNGTYNFNNQMITLIVNGTNMPDFKERWKVFENDKTIPKDKFEVDTSSGKTDGIWKVKILHEITKEILSNNFSVEIAGVKSYYVKLITETINPEISKFNASLDETGLVNIDIHGKNLYDIDSLWNVNGISSFDTQKINSGVRLSFYDDNPKEMYEINYNNENKINVKVTTSKIESIELGGNKNGISVDKYFSVVAMLNLTPETLLSKLTNQSIKDLKNKKTDFEKIDLTIADGSDELNGILKLRISGNYKNKTINEQIINVTGFIAKKDFHPVISNLKFDFFNYFNEFQTIDLISGWDFKNWEKYTSKFDIKENIVSTKIFNFWTLVNSSFVNITNINFVPSEKQVKFNISFSRKTYSGDRWVGDEIIHTTIHEKLTIPSQSNALDFIINNKVSLTRNRIKFIDSKFASYYYAKVYQLSNWGIFEDLFNIEEKERYEKTYFKGERLTFTGTNENGILANDNNGELIVTLYLSKASEDNNFTHAKEFKATGFRKIGDYINKNQNNSSIMVNKNSSITKRIIKLVRNKSDWNSISNSKRFEVSPDELISVISGNLLRIYSSNIEQKNSQSKFYISNNSSTYNSLVLFGIDINADNFEPTSKLFKADSRTNSFESGFIMDYIQFKFKNKPEIILNKIGSILMINITGEFLFSDYPGSNSYSVDANLYVSVNQKEFNNSR